MTTNKRLLFVHPSINPPGGSECVAAWALQALLEDYRVEVLTWLPSNLPEVDRVFGTRLADREIQAQSAPAWLRRLVKLDPDPHSIQPLAILMRWAKVLRRNHDWVVSFYDGLDLGAPALQYLQGRGWGRLSLEERRRAKMPGARTPWPPALFQYRPWRLLSGFSFERVKRNVTLVNSDWLGEQVRQNSDMEPITLYPPVPGDFPLVPWKKRENGFVCIGRFTKDKKYEQMIAILSAVRARGHAVHLHILGGFGDSGTDRSYFERVRQLIRENADWISLHLNASRAEINRLVAHQRYGINACPDESFGIAVGEMVRGGCVVFVPNGGGQVEIIGKEDRLLYTSPDDAVNKISQALDDETLQNTLCQHLAGRAELFTPERFMRELRGIVARHLENASPRARL